MPAAKQHMRIALISMPWALFNRPSIQLGSLKSYIENNSNITVHCYHPYLITAHNIGVTNYQFLSKNGWAGDALYAALLFPQMRKTAWQLFVKACKKNNTIATEFETICEAVEQSVDRWITQTDFKLYTLIGFSVCFNQLFSSLLAADKIKKKTPHLEIVFGGSSCVGGMGESIVKHFSQVNHIIAGEGEQQLLDLCTTLFDTSSQIRHNHKKHSHLQLDALPTPDYRPYFDELKVYFPGMPFNPRIPVEFSRGCWWRKCTFCNLNLQWRGYRTKTVAQMVHELIELHNRHNCLDFTFCDNALPEKQADDFFATVAKQDVDFDFFAEIRPLGDPQKLSRYRNGGLTAVQVGIESLANSLLEKMGKGTTVIENIAIMKYCAENNIDLDGNLIVEFPGSTNEEVAETLANLDFVLPFSPLSTATFFLGAGSPVDISPVDYGIHAVTQHTNYHKLFPPHLLKNIKLLVQDYRGDKIRQRKLWQPVRNKVEKWQHFHQARNYAAVAPLSFRDGGSFILIRQERPNKTPLLHRLYGTSRELYLFCNTVQSFDNILLNFHKLPQKALLIFLDDLYKKKLLFQDSNNFLALAIRQHKIILRN